MSASAFAITKDKIVLLSDGVAMRGDEIYCLDSRKVYKISHRMGLIWMGCAGHGLADVLVDAISEKGLRHRQAAAFIGEQLRKIFEGTQKESLLEKSRYWIVVIGYDKGGNPEGWQLDSTGDYRYEPRKAPLSVGQLGSMVVGFNYNEASFSELVATKWLPKLRGVGPACEAAFIEMVSDYKAQGRPVGGEIYSAILTPHRQKIAP